MTKINLALVIDATFLLFLKVDLKQKLTSSHKKRITLVSWIANYNLVKKTTLLKRRRFYSILAKMSGKIRIKITFKSSITFFFHFKLIVFRFLFKFCIDLYRILGNKNDFKRYPFKVCLEKTSFFLTLNQR